MGSAIVRRTTMDKRERDPRGRRSQPEETHDGHQRSPAAPLDTYLPVRNGIQASDGDTPEAKDKLPVADDTHITAAFKLRMLLSLLEKGEVPPVKDMKKTIAFAISATSNDAEKSSGEDNLQSVQDDQVRAWLSSTFTKEETTGATRKLPTFKTVATVVLAGRQFEIHKESPMNVGLQYPPSVSQLFEDEIDKWDFNVFEAESLTNHQPLRYVGYELFTKHELFKKHKISPSCLDAFLTRVETGYKNHSNPYHNSTHGADVMQTVHHLIYTTGLKSWIDDLEELALLLAAAVHDLDHPGTTNTFNVLSYSEYALCYNDKSVLENHHLYCAFKILKEDDLNILKNLKPEEFRLVRSLMIDTVLATDMSFHFDHLKKMKIFLSTASTPDWAVHGPQQVCIARRWCRPAFGSSVAKMDKKDRSNVFCLLVHLADISHPAKAWRLHSKWTGKLMEEFFRQGDQEKELGRDCSPLCDRNNTSIPDCQLGFMDYIVSPSLEVCGDMLELLLSVEGGERTAAAADVRAHWEGNIQENKLMWREHSNNGKPDPIPKESERKQVEPPGTQKNRTVELCKGTTNEPTVISRSQDTSS